MCQTDSKLIEKRKKPIRAYKHYRINNLGELESTYQGSKVFSKVLNSPLVLEETNKINIGLHSFKRLKDCNSDATDEEALIIATIEIPVDAIVYKGIFDIIWLNHADTYASNKIVIKKLQLATWAKEDFFVASYKKRLATIQKNLEL